MELLAHVWGSPEANEGMDAFLKGRKPDFNQFRQRDKRELERYMDGFNNDLNEPPYMRNKRKQG
jgi:hypothetical protein